MQTQAQEIARLNGELIDARMQASYGKHMRRCGKETLGCPLTLPLHDSLTPLVLCSCEGAATLYAPATMTTMHVVRPASIDETRLQCRIRAVAPYGLVLAPS